MFCITENKASGCMKAILNKTIQSVTNHKYVESGTGDDNKTNSKERQSTAWESASVQYRHLSWTSASSLRIDSRQLIDEVASQYPNRLQMLEDSVVEKILFAEDNSGIAIGVLVRNNSTAVVHTISPVGDRGEIILCGGAIETPRILVASGLKRSGPPDCSHDDSCSTGAGPFQYDCQNNIFPRPINGIGENMQDHVLLPVIYLNTHALFQLCFNLFASIVNSVHAAMFSLNNDCPLIQLYVVGEFFF